MVFLIIYRVAAGLVMLLLPLLIGFANCDTKPKTKTKANLCASTIYPFSAHFAVALAEPN